MFAVLRQRFASRYELLTPVAIDVPQSKHAHLARAVGVLAVPEEVAEPLADVALGLLDEGAHGEAIDEAAGPAGSGGCVGLADAIPKPCEDNPCGLSQARGDVDELGLAAGSVGEGAVGGGLGASGEPALVGVGRLGSRP